MVDNGTPAATATKVCGLSDYQKIRAQKIERNNAKLRLLGLISLEEESVSNALAWGRTIESLEHDAWDAKAADVVVPLNKAELTKPTGKQASGATVSNQRKQKRPATAEVNLPRRTSQRLQGLEPFIQPHNGPSESKRMKIYTDSFDFIQDGASASSLSRTTAAAGTNPTATYAHCLRRVRTMTDKQLKQRIRVIERAMGAHCIIKLAIMASCCRNEGKPILSDMATEALERVQTACLSPESK